MAANAYLNESGSVRHGHKSATNKHFFNYEVRFSLKKDMNKNRRVWISPSGKYPLVRESIANPCMDFQKFTDINMDIHDFRMSVFNYPYKRGYPH